MGLLDNIKSTASNAAKKATSFGANTFGQAKILELLNDSPLAEYGEATGFNLDLGGRVVELTILLRGEAKPVQVTARGYHLEERGEDLRIQIDNLEIDRQWAQRLVDNLFPKLDFTVTIPDEHRSKVGMVLGALG